MALAVCLFGCLFSPSLSLGREEKGTLSFRETTAWPGREVYCRLAACRVSTWGRRRETKCKFIIAVCMCACRFIIRNVIKASNGLRALYYFCCNRDVCVHGRDLIDKAKRSRNDLLRWHYLPLICLCFIFRHTGTTAPTIGLHCSAFKDKQLQRSPLVEKVKQLGFGSKPWIRSESLTQRLKQKLGFKSLPKPWSSNVIDFWGERYTQLMPNTIQDQLNGWTFFEKN